MQFPDCPFRNPECPGKCIVTNKRCSREPQRCYDMLTLWRGWYKGDCTQVNKATFRQALYGAAWLANRVTVFGFPTIADLRKSIKLQKHLEMRF